MLGGGCLSRPPDVIPLASSTWRRDRRKAQRQMTEIVPTPDSVQQLTAQFDTELAAARSPREAQALRDRFLGRKNSIVASWMQRLASAAPEQKKQIGRLANELKQAV